MMIVMEKCESFRMKEIVLSSSHSKMVYRELTESSMKTWRRLSALLDFLKEESNTLKDGKIPQDRINSIDANPIRPLPRKMGFTRFCVDYRILNEVIKKESYSLP